MPTQNCRLCAILRKGSPVGLLDSLDPLQVACVLCGYAVISDEALDRIHAADVSREAVRGYIRAHGKEKKPVKITVATLADIAREARGLQFVSDKLNHLLIRVGKRSKYPGFAVELNLADDFPLAYAENETAFHFLLEQLKEQGLIDYNASGPPAHATLRSRGWERVEDFEKKGGAGRRCFVAMSFDPQFDSTWVAIERAVRAARFVPYRIDREEHVELIPMKMLSDIRASRFVVADITQHRGGVYFEGGYGMALGRTVIWMCKKDDFQNAHFDVQQYRHILYEDLPDLERKLEATIRAVVV